MAAVTAVQGGAPVATADSNDGSLVFVPASGSAPAYFTLDLPVAARTFRVKAVTAVAADILWHPDPNDPAPADWLGRVQFRVHPGSGSAGIALPAQAPVLIPAQPYEGRIATEPMVVGPQGPVDRSYTDEQVADLIGGAPTGRQTLKGLSDALTGGDAAVAQAAAQADQAVAAAAATDATSKANAAKSDAISAAATDAANKAAAARSGAVSDVVGGAGTSANTLAKLDAKKPDTSSLGDAATKNTGMAAGTLAAGDDSRIVGATPKARLGIGTAPGDGTAQDTPLGADLLAWQTAGATVLGNQFPTITGKPLRLPAGSYRLTTPTTVPTTGTGMGALGDGTFTSRLDGVTFIAKDFRTRWSGFSLFSSTGAVVIGRMGLVYQGDGRRFSLADSLHFRDLDVAMQFDGTGAADNLVNIIFEKCNYAIRINATLGIQATNIEALSCYEVAYDFYALGEAKFANFRSIGAKCNLRLRGDTRGPCVESYFLQGTLTNAAKRSLPILGVSDDGNGFVKLALATKIACTVENRGSIFLGAGTYIGSRARARISVGPEIVGQVDAVTVAGSVQLLTASIPFTTDRGATAVLIAANINAGTGTHGYTAKAVGSSVSIDAPLADGAAANGRSITTTTSGGLSCPATNYIALVHASPHGLVWNDDVWLDTGVMYGTYWGSYPVRYVESPTVVLVEMPYSGAASGQAWVLPLLNAGAPGAQIANTAGAFDKGVTISSADDTTITLTTPFAGFPTLPAGASVTIAGWDVIIEAMETTSARVNDHFWHAGNINGLLIKSGFNISFNKTRLKNQIWILHRANPDLRSAQVNFDRGSARGRTSDTYDDVPICGSPTGWTDRSGNVDGNTTRPGTGYTSVASPAKSLPMIGWVAQLIEQRIYEDRIEFRIPTATGLEVNTINGTGSKFGGVTLKALGAAVNAIEMTAGLTGVRALIKQVGETNTGLQIDTAGGAIDLRTGGTRQAIVNNTTGAVAFVAITGATGTSGPSIQAQSGSLANAGLRLGGYQGGPVSGLTPFKDFNFTIATKPAGSLIGPGGRGWCSDAAPANNKAAYVDNSNVWRLSATDAAI